MDQRDKEYYGYLLVFWQWITSGSVCISGTSRVQGSSCTCSPYIPHHLLYLPWIASGWLTFRPSLCCSTIHTGV